MTRRPIMSMALCTLALGGCQVIGVFHRDVGDTPAPTAVPLPTASSRALPATTVRPRASATPTSTSQPVPTARSESTPTAADRAEPTDAPASTRVVPPRYQVDLSPGFGVSIFAEGLKGPRMMTLGPDDEVYVAERGAGRILRLPDRDGGGVVDAIEVAGDGLDAPSSLDFFRDGSMYVGETTRILRLSDPDGDGLFQNKEVIISGLPRGGHSTRTVLFGPDWEYLYVSIGSSCNVCIEEDSRRATVMRYRPDGTEETIYAEGLRNAVGITFRPGTTELWATNNGRDWLGDDQPAETVYLVELGDDAGWPRCHSGRIIDPQYGEPGACDGVKDPLVEMQAHSAPLGLTFYTGDQFPIDYRGDLFIAFHGSWNRTTPTGYKVVRVPMEGDDPGAVQDFAAGWLRDDGSKWGRPVDVLTGPDGGLLVSDDSEGFIYRVFFWGE